MPTCHGKQDRAPPPSSPVTRCTAVSQEQPRKQLALCTNCWKGRVKTHELGWRVTVALGRNPVPFCAVSQWTPSHPLGVHCVVHVSCQSRAATKPEPLGGPAGWWKHCLKPRPTPFLCALWKPRSPTKDFSAVSVTVQVLRSTFLEQEAP